MPHRTTVRPAAAGDVEAIEQLLKPFVQNDILLPRSADDIFQHLQEFLIAEFDGQVVGAVAMHVYGENLGEIRSLAVDPQFQHHGIGRLLVKACESWAAGLGIAQLFALTYVVDFFTRLGYRVVAKEALPYKIWTVCVHCPRFSACDEVAVMKKLSDVPVKPMMLKPVIEMVE